MDEYFTLDEAQDAAFRHSVAAATRPMSLNRYAKRTDASQAAIIRVLEQAHVAVWVINWPCDLLTHYQGRWQPLEVKAGKRKRSDQKAQGDFLKTHGVPIVTTPTEALIALSILPCPALKDRVL